MENRKHRKQFDNPNMKLKNPNIWWDSVGEGLCSFHQPFSQAMRKACVGFVCTSTGEERLRINFLIKMPLNLYRSFASKLLLGSHRDKKPKKICGEVQNNVLFLILLRTGISTLSCLLVFRVCRKVFPSVCLARQVKVGLFSTDTVFA